MTHNNPLPHQVPPAPARPTPIGRLLTPFSHFLASSTSGGVLILCCVAGALALANGSLRGPWETLLHGTIGVRLGDTLMQTSVTHLIDDGLMSVFFLLIGLEIKRELLLGELASPRRAALPLVVGLGGMAVPAIFFTIFNAGGPGARGWGIPMATDIAFALGILRLAGGVSSTALVLLAALAIVDDLGAVIVIGLFYSSNLNPAALWTALALFLGLLAMNRLGVRHPIPYALGGLALWSAVLGSGVHATISGVLLALCIPIRGAVDPDRTIAWTAEFARAELLTPNSGATIERLAQGVARGRSPLVAWERALAPWVNFVIVPVFALANAGVTLDARMIRAAGDPIFLGVLIGLVLGKPLGVIGAGLLAARLGLAELPAGLGRRGLVAVGALAGVGFTMSIFIAELAFDDPQLIATAKGAILLASVVAGSLGYTLCRHAIRAARRAA